MISSSDSIIASVVRSGLRQPSTWTAELLEAVVPDQRPSPFQDIEPSFPSLEELCTWLSHPPVKTNTRYIASQGV